MSHIRVCIISPIGNEQNNNLPSLHVAHQTSPKPPLASSSSSSPPTHSPSSTWHSQSVTQMTPFLIKNPMEGVAVSYQDTRSIKEDGQNGSNQIFNLS